MALRTLQDIPELNGKKVFVRVDFNVPLDKDGQVKDDKRIVEALPTLKHLLENGVNQLILATHIGRPKGTDPTLKTDSVARKLEELLGQSVVKVDDWGEKGLPTAKIVILENLRFHSGEKSKDETERDTFGRQLASLANIYVNEAFSNSHRAHASMTSIPKFIPGYAGMAVQKEAEAISQALSNPKLPLIAVIGGLKADKINAIHHLMNVADRVLVAGALACNLLKARGYEIGSSKSDDEGMEEKATMVKEVNASKHVELPVDFIVADDFSDSANTKIVPAGDIPPGWMALDIGPESAKYFANLIESAKTVLWFGPIGVFEMPAFANGTRSVAEAMALLSTEWNGTTIVGGGDSASAIKKLGLADKMTLVSTGGGASLEMIEGKKLPGLEILEK